MANPLKSIFFCCKSKDSIYANPSWFSILKIQHLIKKSNNLKNTDRNITKFKSRTKLLKYGGYTKSLLLKQKSLFGIFTFAPCRVGFGRAMAIFCALQRTAFAESKIFVYIYTVDLHIVIF